MCRRRWSWHEGRWPVGGWSRLEERLRTAQAHALVVLGGEPGQCELLELGQLFDGRVPVGDAVLQIGVLCLQTLHLGLFGAWRPSPASRRAAERRTNSSPRRW